MSLTPPSVKQHSAALRGLFNWLVIKQDVPDNPALFLKGPKFIRQIGITAILEAEQMRQLLNSIPLTREVKVAAKYGGREGGSGCERAARPGPSSPSWLIHLPG